MYILSLFREFVYVHIYCNLYIPVSSLPFLAQTNSIGLGYIGIMYTVYIVYKINNFCSKHWYLNLTLDTKLTKLYLIYNLKSLEAMFITEC